MVIDPICNHNFEPPCVITVHIVGTYLQLVLKSGWPALIKWVDRCTGEQKLLIFSATLALSSKFGMSLFIRVMATWQHRWLMSHYQSCLSHMCVDQIIYSFCSSSIPSSVIPLKSWLSKRSISGTKSDAQYFPALSTRSESSWNRSTIFRIPHPGWVGEEPFLFIEKHRSMSSLPHRKFTMSLTFACWVSLSHWCHPSHVQDIHQAYFWEHWIHLRTGPGQERKTYYTGIEDYSQVRQNDIFVKCVSSLINSDYIALCGFGKTWEQGQEGGEWCGIFQVWAPFFMGDLVHFNQTAFSFFWHFVDCLKDLWQ